MNAETEIQRLLSEHGAVLRPGRKHKVWKLPNGQILVRSHTPGDRATALIELTTLKRLLGLNGGSGPGERREKPKPTNGNGNGHKSLPKLKQRELHQLPLAGQLHVLELEKEHLDLESEVERLQVEIGHYADEILRLTEIATAACPCWWCRVIGRFRRS